MWRQMTSAPIPHLSGSRCKHITLVLAVNSAVNKASALLWKYSESKWVPNYGCDLIFWLFHVNKPYLPHIVKRQHGIYIGMADQFSKETVCSSWFCHQRAAWTLASPLTSLSLRSSSILTPSLPSYIIATRAWIANWQQTPDLSQHSWESQRHSYTWSFNLNLPGDFEDQQASVDEGGSGHVAPENFKSPSNICSILLEISPCTKPKPQEPASSHHPKDTLGCGSRRITSTGVRRPGCPATSWAQLAVRAWTR